jgi:hypothetical protein
MLTNMHNPPAEGNFCDDHGNAIKPEIVCSGRGKRRSIVMKCKKCDVGLCILGCFEEYHTKARLN